MAAFASGAVETLKGLAGHSAPLPQASAALVASARQSVLTSNDYDRTLRGSHVRNNSTAGSLDESSASSKKMPSPAGEAELQTLMNHAEYEIHQDPYRGVLSHQQSLETQTTITTPWNACQWGTLPPEPLEDQSEDLADAQKVVRHVGHCACPSLKAWTVKAIANRSKSSNSKGNRKRRRKLSAGNSNGSDSVDAEVNDQPTFTVAGRPEGANFVCPCDYNPLCLATLGGVINDIIQERCRELDTDLLDAKVTETPTNGNSICDTITDSSDDKDVVIVDVTTDDQKSNGRAFHDTKEFVDVDIDETFAFLTTPQENVKVPRDSKKRPLTTTVKPLEPESDQPPDKNIADVFSRPMMSSQELNDIRFSPETEEGLGKTRQTVEVETSPIDSYVHRTLRIQHATSRQNRGLTADRYLRILTEWHRQLQFANPLHSDKRLPPDHISLALPPGIQNLGATCYLNTQLQCLAQNLTFLNGIFTWRMVNTNHNMNSVMARLQQLLAQMLIGGDCKLTTLDFSNALGLEPDEQQDPNEFARLLFDRMDESFQQCDNNGDLANLLQNIFHGETTYETVCSKCNKKSFRSEGFMDLNLPIVKRPPDSSKKKQQQTSVADFFIGSNKNFDTDLQWCLDQYTFPEILDGDNQYFCDNCNCKRDAKRYLKLTKLPPVLNVQLSRYVFDRVKFVKKKVSDKVLLPISLEVNHGNGRKRKYLLCAVMRHHGTSAYSGHYTAEAMDWTTGKWFEFNDETVKLLPDGPSCSFNPDERLGSRPNSNSDSRLTGSQDAYNMYYVDEEYLATTTANTMLQREGLCQGHDINNGLLEEVMRQRGKLHSELSALCFADGKLWHRLSCRKAGIRKYIFHDAQSLVQQHRSRRQSAKDEKTCCWVATDFLRRYLQCEPDTDLDDMIRDDGPVLRNFALMCMHNRLTPQTAMRGKLIPKSKYDRLLALLAAERALISGRARDAGPDIDGVEISPDRNLICTICSKLYQDRISTKYDVLRRAKDLYDALEGKADDSALFYKEGEEPTSDDESYTYIIARAAATKFRKNFAAVLKSVSNIEEGGTVNELVNVSMDAPIYEGLEGIDISALHTTTQSLYLNDDLASQLSFTDSITCPHGNCNATRNSRQVRFITPGVWRLVKALFPDTLELKWKRVPKDSTTSEGCPTCKAEKESLETFRENLLDWAKETKNTPGLKQLLDAKQPGQSFPSADADKGRIVHQDNITAWQKLVKTLSSASRLKGESIVEVKSFVARVGFPNFESQRYQTEQDKLPVSKLVESMHSMNCNVHHQVVKGALTTFWPTSEGAGTTHRGKFQWLAIEEYDAYAVSLVSLLILMQTQTFADNSDSFIEHENLTAEIRRLLDLRHPMIEHELEAEKNPDQTVLRLTREGQEQLFSLRPGFCENAACLKKLLASTPVHDEVADGNMENGTINCSSKPGMGDRNGKKRGFDAAEPILVESDLEDSFLETFSLRVFEALESASIEEVLESLQTISAVSPSPIANLDQNYRRRSTRKLKPNYPCGVLLSEDTIQVGFHHNLAAVRLLMYEKCNIPLSAELAIVIAPSNEEPRHHKIEASSFLSALALPNWISELRDGGTPLDLKKDILLVRQQQSSSDAGGLHDTMLESLLLHANLDSTVHSDSAKKNKKPRASERGFRGTLLQSSNVSQAADTSDKKQEPDTLVESNASQVSDEEMEVEPLPLKYSPRERNPKGPQPIEVEDSPTQPPSPISANASQGALSDSDDDIDSVLSKGPVFLGGSLPSAGSQGHKAAARSGLNDSLLEEMTMQLVQMVQKALGEGEDGSSEPPPIDDSKVWNAVGWVLRNNSREKDLNFLCDSALAKYWSIFE